MQAQDVKEYQQHLAMRAAEISDPYAYIQQKAPIALLVLSDIIDGAIPSPIELRAKVASNWLDRAGYSATRKVMITRTSNHVTAEDIAVLKARSIAAQHELNNHDSDPKYDSTLFARAAGDIAINDAGEFITLDSRPKNLTLEEAEALYAFDRSLEEVPTEPLSDYDRWLLARGVDKDTEARNHAYFMLLYENELKHRSAA